ncbi:hypothetical protein AWB67_02289 [Caballeronia terrestris]|uniref:NrS-1 polymerase-like helicase domain-containing protein n=1 Tax=Caballeronia terrestris TaxID=1226301 RepID=A0A158I010_9BURK|nr:DUF5906 domain-containing protein [Caballeronia terrestris]SAL49955.1 hypothetical protein AWB67_02289 [Caballeronia terrestris]
MQSTFTNTVVPSVATPLNSTAAADALRELADTDCPREVSVLEAPTEAPMTRECFGHVAGPVDRVALAGAGMSFDEAEVRKFVALVGLPLMLLGIDSITPPALQARTCTTADEVVAAVREWNPKKWNIYWLPNVAIIGDKKPGKQDVMTARYVWADCDPNIKQHGSFEAARDHLLTTHAAKLAPIASLLIDSGNGLQAFFKLDAPFPLFGDGDYMEYEALNERVGLAFQGPGTHNCDRIMRLPGTLNWPTAAKLKKGYPQEPRMSRLLHASKRTYAFEQLKQMLPQNERAIVPPKNPVINGLSKGDVSEEVQRFEALLATDHDLSARWDGSDQGLIDTTGSAMDMSLYGMLVHRGFSHEAIVEIMEPWPHGGQGREQGERYWNRLRARTAATPRTSKAVDDVVAELNMQYAVALVGGSAVVLDVASSPVNFLKPEAFKTLLRNRTVEVPNAHGEIKLQPIADMWMKHPARSTYKAVDFAPGGGAREGVFNLFRGWAVEPYADMSAGQAARQCNLILTHIKENVCRGDQEAFNYLIGWYAHLFQSPAEKPSVAVVVRGEKGVGKSKLTEAIAALLGPHAVTVSQRTHLTGQFNAHQALALLIVAEEAVWAGDKQAESALKHLITGSTITLERKGVDAMTVKSCARVAMNSNSEWVFPASSDERRLFALDCGSDHKQDHAYFKAIDEQLYGPGRASHEPGQESPGLRALLTYLLRLDLTGFNVRLVPETDALKAQRAASLEPHEEFLKESLENHEICGKSWDQNAQPIVKRELYDAYRSYMRDRPRLYRVSQEVFAKTIKRVFEWRDRQRSGGKREWSVAGWSESRAAFEAAMKVKIDD